MLIDGDAPAVLIVRTYCCETRSCIRIGRVRAASYSCFLPDSCTLSLATALCVFVGNITILSRHLVSFCLAIDGILLTFRFDDYYKLLLSKAKTQTTVAPSCPGVPGPWCPRASDRPNPNNNYDAPRVPTPWCHRTNVPCPAFVSAHRTNVPCPAFVSAHRTEREEEERER